MCIERPHLDQAALPRLEEQESAHTLSCPAGPTPSGQATHQAPHMPDLTTTSLPKLFDPVYTDTTFSRLGETASYSTQIIGKSNKMERQKTMSQRKKQEKTAKKNFNEVKISIMPDKEFKEMVIKVLNKL